MVRPDLLLFGYVVIAVVEEDKALASDILLGHGLGAAFDKKGRFIIPYRLYECVKALFDSKIRYTASEPRGLYGLAMRYKGRIGIIIGIIFTTLLFVISSDFVWDVRIEGIDSEKADEIYGELSESGLSVGKRWSRLDKNQVEINMLRNSDSVAWLNINRRGTVAYVKVSDKKMYEEDEEPEGYANVVAARDCVIEEIMVESGYPMVKKGESVKAGEVLISGVIPTELGGGFCYAKGSVTGRYTDKVEVEAERNFTVKTYTDRTLIKYTLKFFGKDINIFKKYGQPSEGCDIIEKTEYVTVWKRLPISIRKTYSSSYETKTSELSDAELVSLASERLREALLLFLADKEAKRMVSSGEFTEIGYRMVCDTVVSSEVTKIQEFEVE